VEYFLALPDSRIANPLGFRIDEKEFLSKKPLNKNLGKIHKLVLVDLIVSKVLFNSYFFLADELKKLFLLYDESFEMVPLFIFNHDYTINVCYWRLEMEATPDVVVNKFLHVQDMMIDDSLLKDKPIHKIHYEKQTFILVNHYVAESILRRFSVGIYLQAVKSV